MWSHRSSVLVFALVLPALTAAAAVPAKSAFDPQSLRIPAMCRHGAATLRDGVKDFGTDPSGASRGDASLISAIGSLKSPVPRPVLAKQRGSSAHGAFAMVPIRCSAGGVDWPETLVLYTSTGRILAHTDLGRFGYQEHASVTALTLRGDRARVHWRSYDGAGFSVHDRAATFTLRHGELAASHIEARVV